MRVQTPHPGITTNAVRDPDRPLPEELWPLRAALEALVTAGLKAVMAAPPGWHRSERSPCLMALLGESCSGIPGVQPCECCRPWTRILDHKAMWSTSEGLVLTAEPYELDLTSNEFAAFVRFCRALGLSVHASGKSSHYPGCTLLLTIRRADEGAPVGNEEEVGGV